MLPAVLYKSNFSRTCGFSGFSEKSNFSSVPAVFETGSLFLSAAAGVATGAAMVDLSSGFFL